MDSGTSVLKRMALQGTQHAYQISEILLRAGS